MTNDEITALQGRLSQLVINGSLDASHAAYLINLLGAQKASLHIATEEEVRDRLAEYARLRENGVRALKEACK